MLLICPLIYKYTLLRRLTCRDTSVNLKHTIALGLLLAPTFAIAENTPDLNEIWRIVQQQQQTIKALTEKLDRALRVLDRTQTQSCPVMATSGRSRIQLCWISSFLGCQESSASKKAM